MWIITFAMPDLTLKESLGNENIAIVPHDDSRVIEIANQSLYAKALVEIFKKLELGKISHGDMKGTNVIYLQTGACAARY
jgi:hypothetical protein